ncbi:hypothetical protein [Planctomicrobium piriforme]|uniref:Uncharacterized protein n=1 Tax=Planctomicrobium piriforme TaxID=1576369 RepID=A0A1I3BL65_9PLAN|nr:hypothetical protein [Planctomicrobium piriforme]SFH63008.1 hypothetical protein SAMN05421753_101516 [Planctomicrobium piriforme]
MSRQSKNFYVILCLVGILSFSAWPLWELISVKAASNALQARAQAAVAAHPELKPALTIAMMDGVLTHAEAKEIVEATGEKVTAEE